ncbi:MAG: NosD domain-containing protein, partial [Candidatus Thermoplasmatota archaeon]|nr:NosD domain-containing protein [Candidatus Thermoplasmatota archaeon]
GTTGFFLASNANYNTLTRCDISGYGYGLYVYPSDAFYNNIYNNNFFYSAISYATDGGVNYYSHPVFGGNYWAGWTGPDHNCDGYVDVPRSIAGGTNQDLKPLTTPYGWLTAPPLSGDWTITEDIIYSNMNVNIDGHIIIQAPASVQFINSILYTKGIIVEAGATLSIDPSTVYVEGQIIVEGYMDIYDNTALLFNCSSDGEFGIQVNAGGTLLIRESSVLMSNNTFAYSFVALDGSNVLIEDSTIRDSTGLWLASTNATIVGATFQNNTFGAIVNTTGTIVFENCTWLGNGLDLHASNGTAVLVNTDLDDGNVTAVDTGVALFRQYAFILLEEVNTLASVSGATILIEDSDVFSDNQLTDVNGELNWYVITTGMVDSGGFTNYNNFTFTVSKTNYTGNSETTTVGMMENVYITLDAYPSPILTSPLNGEIITGIIDLVAFINELDVVSVDFWYYDGAWNLIGAGINTGPNLWTYEDWDTSTVPDGTNIIISVNATDLAGGEGYHQITLAEIDNTPPSPIFTNPLGGENLAGEVNLTITGDVDITLVEFYYYNDTVGWNFIGLGLWSGAAWYLEWDTTGIDLETVTISANATDNVGLWGNVSVVLTEIDN